MSTRTMLRQVGILSAAQALFQTVSVLVMTIGGLAGEQVASSRALATVPIGTMYLGTAISTPPASLWMARVGRRTGFLVGATLGVLGAGIAAFGISVGSLWILAFGTLLIGSYQGFAQFYRFAASEAADDQFRPRAISLVLGGGIVAALLGPFLARVGRDLLSTDYVGSFLIALVVSILAIVVLSGLARTVETAAADHTAPTRPLREIVAQYRYQVALFGAATGYGVMLLAMTATPIAMKHHDHDLSAAAMVIQIHVLGMFLPSFVTGSLISRFGVLQVMLAGVAILAVHVLTTLTGLGVPSFAAALFLLGVGWNFLYIGGTTLLTSTYTPAERGRAQAVNDMTIFIVGLTSSFSAAALLDLLGWQLLNVVLLPWLALAAMAIVVLAIRDRRALVASTAD